MAKDLYDKLCGYYEFMLGPLPWREEFERALRETVGEDELRILFRIPFSGAIPHAKLAKKANSRIARGLSWTNTSTDSQMTTSNWSASKGRSSTYGSRDRRLILGSGMVGAAAKLLLCRPLTPLPPALDG
jgi:hypothetical protein